MPGAITAFINVNSVNKLLKTVVPVFTKNLVNDAKIPIPFDFKDPETGGWLYKGHIDDLHVENVDFGKINFGFLPDSNTLRLELDNTDIKFSIDGKITAGLEVIQLGLLHAHLKNFGCDVNLDIDSKDKVNWQLDQTSEFSLEGFEIITDSGVANWLLDILNSYVTEVARV